MRERSFPPSFLWGAATSCYQIEGATEADGRGVSIWDTFCRQPGKVKGRDNADVACDHFHRVEGDVAMMAELGLQAYRFSIAWPRILPFGVGTPVEAGLAFYDRLVDTLLEAGIEPWGTLYHWDLPQALQDHGGWPERATGDAFVAYADVVSRRLGDRVKHWITHNEPWCITILGYQTGQHAPGWQDPSAALAAAHHVLLSHGQAVPVIRANSPGAEVGITLNLVPGVPASGSVADAEATRTFDGHFNRWFLEPVVGRGYPEDMVIHYQQSGVLPRGPLPFVQPGDVEQMAAPIDFLGINYYSRGIIRSEVVSEADNAPRTVAVPPPERCTDIGWEVWPDGLYDLLTRLHRDYPGLPLVITENGAAYDTGPTADGQVHDEARIAYLDGHLDACHRAITDGVDLRAYFVWSLMDNFEWQEGYTQRFGVVWVDYATQQRIPKDSARWYAAVIERNGLPRSG